MRKNPLKHIWKDNSLEIVFGAVIGLIVGLMVNFYTFSSPSILKLIEMDKSSYGFLFPMLGSTVGIAINYLRKSL